jgi:UDP-N-acetylmuramoylalanine--D-glutamate ligase
MENKTAAFKTWIKNKRVAVLGVGISNRPLIRFIHALGANITAFDILEMDDPVLSKTRTDFLQEGISLSWSVGKDYLKQLKGFDVIFRTPKMRPDVAQLRAERECGAVITSEMEDDDNDPYQSDFAGGRLHRPRRRQYRYAVAGSH